MMIHRLADRTALLRIGAVSYLNAKPLVCGLGATDPSLRVSFDYPSRLADDLFRGLLEIALIPSVEFLREPGYQLVSNACIACQGPVLSVKLLSRVPWTRVRRLALDEGSRTSCYLARILLREKLGIEPRLERLGIDSPLAACSADCVLVIGDRALHTPGDAFPFAWDLGEQWCQWTGLPFVFAMWVARAGVNVDRVAGWLAQARDEGLARLEELARVESGPAGLSFDRTLSYFRDNLHFHLGEEERAGLICYFRHASRLADFPFSLPDDIDDRVRA